MRERRARSAEIRVDEGTPGRFEAVVLRYNVIDDYNTRFRPGVFAESLARRLPRITWAHQWDEPLGRYVDFVDTQTELTLIGEFDDFDAVPRARQAYAQLRSGTIDQFSVGFSRLADEQVDPELVDGQRGIVDIVKGDLDEAALVLVGAVPGTHLVSVRSAAGGVDLEAVLAIAKRKVDGDITDEQARVALELLAVDDTPPDPDPPVEGDPPADPPPEAVELDADIEAALAVVTDRSR